MILVALLIGFVAGFLFGVFSILDTMRRNCPAAYERFMAWHCTRNENKEG